MIKLPECYIKINVREVKDIFETVDGLTWPIFDWKWRFIIICNTDPSINVSKHFIHICWGSLFLNDSIFVCVGPSGLRAVASCQITSMSELLPALDISFEHRLRVPQATPPPTNVSSVQTTRPWLILQERIGTICVVKHTGKTVSRLWTGTFL